MPKVVDTIHFKGTEVDASAGSAAEPKVQVAAGREPIHNEPIYRLAEAYARVVHTLTPAGRPAGVASSTHGLCAHGCALGGAASPAYAAPRRTGALDRAQYCRPWWPTL